MNIKHKILGVVMLNLLPLSLSAQSEMEAFRLNSPYDPMGSARFAALSGAMGAVGSDASSLVRNPAGSRSSVGVIDFPSPSEEDGA